MSEVDDALKKLTKALESGIYGRPYQDNVRNLLDKLGIKSAKQLGYPSGSLLGGGVLQIEDLESTFKQVTFDSGKLRLWKP